MAGETMGFNNMKVMTESAILKMIPEAADVQKVNEILVLAAKLPKYSAIGIAESLEARIMNSPFTKQQKNRAINYTRKFRTNPDKIAAKLKASR